MAGGYITLHPFSPVHFGLNHVFRFCPPMSSSFFALHVWVQPSWVRWVRVSEVRPKDSAPRDHAPGRAAARPGRSGDLGRADGGAYGGPTGVRSFPEVALSHLVEKFGSDWKRLVRGGGGKEGV